MVSNNNTKSAYASVPISHDLENIHHNNNKYIENNNQPASGVNFSILALLLMAFGTMLLITLAIALTIWIHPKCTDAANQKAIHQIEYIQNARLPSNLQPLNYRIKLVPFLHPGNFTTHGEVNITINTKEETSEIVLNVYDILIHTDSVKVRHLNDVLYLHVINQHYDNVSQTYSILLKEKLRKGQQYQLEMQFVGQLNDNMQGFYRSHYKDPKTNEIKWMASTQFSPTDARRAFPCFDEPSFKATFTISIARWENMTTISNMPKKSTESIVIDNMTWKMDNYLETPLMSTYLVAFVVSDLHLYQHNSSGRPLTFWTRAKSVDQTRLGLDLTSKMLSFFESYFTINFPLPKIDIVAVPDFGFDGMENWGLIAYRESVILSDDKTASVHDRFETYRVVAHEMAHQWFGNLVSPGWWDDLWLKEGFSTYFIYMAVEQVNPDWDWKNQFLLHETYKSFKTDSLNFSRPISFDVTTTEDIRQSFDSLSYSKGASIIRMLSHIVGEDSFHLALIEFLNKHKYGNAHRDDLWDTLTSKQQKGIQLKTDIKEVIDTWAREPGFPVVTALKNYSSNEVHLRQKRFLLFKEVEDETLWWVPISYTADVENEHSDTRPKVWLKNERETSFILQSKKWWLLNVHQTGYFIVNYDEQNWRKLLSAVMEFSQLTRTQLISDSMNLARVNLLDYDIPLRMLTNIALRDEQVLFPVHSAALEQVSFLYDMLIATPIYKEFEDFIYRIYYNAFLKFDMNEKPTDSYNVQSSRRLILDWACKRPGSKCTNDARALFKKWSQYPNYDTIPPNLRSVVFCTAIREGDDNEWNFAYNYYLVTESNIEKNMVLDSLGCSQTPWILSRYLNKLLQNDTAIKKQDSLRVFQAVARNPMGYSVAFSFLRQHWLKLNEHLGPAFGMLSKMVLELSKYMNTPYQLAELETFKEKNANHLGTSSQSFDRVIEIVKGNIYWMNHRYQSIEKWLNDHAEQHEPAK